MIIEQFIDQLTVKRDKLKKKWETECERNPFGYSEGFYFGSVSQLSTIIEDLEKILNDN